MKANKGDNQMALYRVIRLIGSSPNSWDEAASSKTRQHVLVAKVLGPGLVLLRRLADVAAK